MSFNTSRDNLPRDFQTSNQLKIKLKPGSAPPWTSYLSSCLEQGAFCDVFLECDDALLGAHKIVLASASSHLSDLLLGISQDQATILLPGISKQILQLYLRLVYGQTVVISKNFMEALLVKFRGIDVALGIAKLKLSKRNAKGKVGSNDLDLSENVISVISSANAVRCASCHSEITRMALDLDNLLEMNAGGDEMEENLTANDAGGDVLMEENITANDAGGDEMEENLTANDAGGDVLMKENLTANNAGGDVLMQENLTANNAGDEVMEENHESQMQGTEGEGVKAVRQVEGKNWEINDSQNQIVKPIKSLSNKEKKLISKKEGKKVKKELEKVSLEHKTPGPDRSQKVGMKINPRDETLEEYGDNSAAPEVITPSNVEKRKRKAEFTRIQVEKPKKEKMDEMELLNKARSCGICSKMFSSNNSLENHINRHRQNKAVDDENAQKSIYRCAKCDKDKFFSNAACIVAHLESKHTEAGEKKIKCVFPVCQFQAKREDLIRHIRSKHTKENHFPCGGCDKKFASYEALKGHERRSGHKQST